MGSQLGWTRAATRVESLDDQSVCLIYDVLLASKLVWKSVVMLDDYVVYASVVKKAASLAASLVWRLENLKAD